MGMIGIRRGRKKGDEPDRKKFESQRITVAPSPCPYKKVISVPAIICRGMDMGKGLQGLPGAIPAALVVPRCSVGGLHAAICNVGAKIDVRHLFRERTTCSKNRIYTVWLFV